MSDRQYFFDLGNTRLKAWACASDGTVVATAAVVHAGNSDVALAQLDEQFAAVPGLIGVASVWAAGANEAFAEACRRRWGVTPRFARSEAERAGVRCAYENPAKLGVDRWLCVLAVADGVNDYCVVDCGTAMTIDVVTRDRIHKGGYIVPGLSMQVNSLIRHTQRVRISEPAESRLDWGRDTSSAVLDGVLLGVVAVIEKSWRRLCEEQGGAPRLVLTGGDAAQIGPWLSCPHTIEPELLLTGLQHYFATPDIK